MTERPLDIKAIAAALNPAIERSWQILTIFPMSVKWSGIERPRQFKVRPVKEWPYALGAHSGDIGILPIFRRAWLRLGR